MTDVIGEDIQLLSSSEEAGKGDKVYYLTYVVFGSGVRESARERSHHLYRELLYLLYTLSQKQ